MKKKIIEKCIDILSSLKKKKTKATEIRLTGTARNVTVAAELAQQ